MGDTNLWPPSPFPAKKEKKRKDSAHYSATLVHGNFSNMDDISVGQNLSKRPQKRSKKGH